MNILKRILLFAVCFVVIALAVSVVTGAIVGVTAVRDAADTSRASEVGASAARAFGLNYGLFIWLVSLVLSAGIAFRWIGALIAAALATLAYFFLPGAASLQKPFAQSSPPASAQISPQRSVANAAQQRAMQLYPELGIANSPLNREFIRRYRKYQIEDKHYFDDPDWPTRLAKESKAGLTRK